MTKVTAYHMAYIGSY